jgi:hypothetical protein
VCAKSMCHMCLFAYLRTYGLGFMGHMLLMSRRGQAPCVLRAYVSYVPF